MTAASPILRTLVMYVLSLPVAIVLGYALATPLDLSNLGIFLVVAFILSLPLQLRWHHPLLLLSWNSSALFYLLPGPPHFWLVITALSLTISMARRTMSRTAETNSVSALNWPLILLAVTVLATAQMTGGIRLRSFGSEGAIGGKHYIVILGAIAGYYAISLNRIPPARAKLYTALYLLGGTTVLLGTVPLVLGREFDFLWYLFPVDRVTAIGSDSQWSRFFGVSVAAQFFIAFLFSKYGLSGLFLAGKPWRLAVLILALGLGLFGGYRSVLVRFLLVFAIQFHLEGLFRSRLLLPITIFGCGTAALMVGFAPHLPKQVQRCMTFLPVEVDPIVRVDADYSTRWRLDMWKAVLPEVPRCLLLGKGYAIDRSDLDLSVDPNLAHANQAGNYYAAMISSDFHNGPLSLLLPLGLWGFLAFAWLGGAGLRVLHRNFRYGDPALKTINTYLLAAFSTQLVMFYFVYGSFHTQLAEFLGLLGLSVALNGGACKPAAATKAEDEPPSPLVPVMPRSRSLLGRR
jgi:hypothetical protein